MVRMFARHQVADYDAWRKVCDALDRSSMGVRQHAVYQSVSDPNEVTVLHDFDDQQTSESFVASDELKAAMTEAGVGERPQHLDHQRDLTSGFRTRQLCPLQRCRVPRLA